MSARELQDQLNALSEQLDQNPPLSEEERQNLLTLMAQIKSEIELEAATKESNLVDQVNLVIERLEVEHPAIAGALRNIVMTLGNIGV
ncbi:hypothetical protein M2401_001156 [Pseudomonas sp. JUb42]|jgi:hypothetical protein|uniref:DUF4404 family protein n=1 Tax=Pseudomonas sp. JUb42 TaxID=2940611 RepID=UPI00216723CA|nr:DUF4404 family protein [Pseudomonas sp. JUb42]MCS3467435.1 hypothetical protein [Pseudomonas sp. JUb42]